MKGRDSQVRWRVPKLRHSRHATNIIQRLQKNWIFQRSEVF